ncbi:NAD(P)H pyrophosphatase NUDT13, mitochondrial [Lethenteron reissneri]|uniref:NAD(P)H pyrophosphatase NUDT13, mitochondrial n=1 Tax=Lethenteron reissneri TaxID=7753 RepID=UPI002AB7C3AD|nr:NAD(P)H pyrophosphatase NUDT13, mitochondrial [Lethenteron reissneri]
MALVLLPLPPPPPLLLLGMARMATGPGTSRRAAADGSLRRRLRLLAGTAPTRHLAGHVRQVRLVQELKENDAKCRQAMDSGLYLLFHRLAPFVQRHDSAYRATWLPAAEVLRVLDVGGQPPERLHDAVLLDCTPDLTPRFALDTAACANKGALEAALDGSFMKMRSAFFLLSGKDAHMLSKGQALLRWHGDHRFSGRSGRLSLRDASGSKRTCPDTGHVQYPQMAPVVIVLVVDGDRCLLARKDIHPPGMYSTVAGFCDIGENVDMAVRREVAEEVGVTVSSLNFVFSQHWPFPSSSLMLACHAVAEEGHTEISVDTTELEDARWFSRDEVRSAFSRPVPPEVLRGWAVSSQEESSQAARGDVPFWVPPKWTVAHWLIREWVQVPKQG